MGNDRTLQIDEEGYLSQKGQRLNDDRLCPQLLKNLFVKNRTYWSRWEDQEVPIQAFDAPLVIQSLDLEHDQLKVTCPYSYRPLVEMSSLCVDEWDRFHIRRDDGLTMVFSRKAQAQLFELADRFDDDSITIKSTRYSVPPYFADRPDASHENFWSDKYTDWESKKEAPGWDLNQASPFLKDVLPQLKILRQRIAVLGAGAGHDAAYLAGLGHLVTAFDISPNAIEKASSLYPPSNHLRYEQMDLLKPNEPFWGQFDLVLEHTFFCAINPADRSKAIQTMKKLLAPGGHLLANFFVITPEGGPPFGATEWEIRKRLDGKFKPLYWTRWNNSPQGRRGWELIVYASLI